MNSSSKNSIRQFLGWLLVTLFALMVLSFVWIKSAASENFDPFVCPTERASNLLNHRHEGRVTLPNCDPEGMKVQNDSVEVVVPGPGEGIELSAHGPLGHTLLHVYHGEDGAIEIQNEDEPLGDTFVDPEPEDPSRAEADACNQSSYALTGRKPPGSLGFYFNPETVPGYLTNSEAKEAILDAANNINIARNNCGLPDNVSLNLYNIGNTTTYRADIVSDSSTLSCASRDGVSVHSFGAISPGYSAAACSWTSGTNSDGTYKTVESDVEYNKVDRKFFVGDVPGSCTDKLDLQGLATHELGHSAGLFHPSVGKQLTMYPGQKYCTKYRRTLGLGDVRGLEQLH